MKIDDSVARFKCPVCHNVGAGIHLEVEETTHYPVLGMGNPSASGPDAPMRLQVDCLQPVFSNRSYRYRCAHCHTVLLAGLPVNIDAELEHLLQTCAMVPDNA